VILSLGSPLGWALLSGSTSESPACGPKIYAYLTLGTAAAFAIFGAVLGRLADQLMVANKELRRLAAFDGLTGLRNARTFRLELERACATARRTGKPVALVLLDLDHFKLVNDTYGHQVGDLVLAQTGKVLLESARAADASFRAGGEEFAVLCESTSSSEAAGVAERLRSDLAGRSIQLGDKKLAVTASLGVATLGGDAEPKALFQAADQALYRAKEGGRNRVVVAP
jgi:diguanylate cyclase